MVAETPHTLFASFIMINFFISLLFVFLYCSSSAQLSTSIGFGWANEPWNPDGYALNVGYGIPLKENGKWIIKPNISYKNMKNYEPYLDADMQNQAVAINATIGYVLVNNKKYNLIPSLGPSLRWNRFWGRSYNPINTISSVGSGLRYLFILTPDNPENSLEMTRFGFAFQVENKFSLGESAAISLTPFLESDISFDPHSGGFYITYTFK